MYSNAGGILRRLAELVTLFIAVTCLSCAAFATDPTCYAFVFVDEPANSPYYAPQGGTASVPFSTYTHKIEIYGESNAQYCVTWYMTLRCTTNWGGHVAYVDTDWSGECPATADGNGIWRHFADGLGELSGSLSLSAGSYYACGDCYFTAFFVGGDPEDTFGKAATPDSKPFGVVTQAPPGGGGGS